MGLIFYLSSLSDTEVSRPLESDAVAWLGELRSYAAHIVLYAVLAALIQTAFWGWNSGFRVRWVIAAAVVASLFGISDEYHQSFVDGRSATVIDVLVNCIAATAAAALLWRLAAGMARSRAPGRNQGVDRGSTEDSNDCQGDIQESPLNLD